MVEEVLQTGKRVVETGTVRVSKQVVEVPQQVSIPLNQTDYIVDRVPVNRYVDEAPPGTRQEGETTIIPVLREVLVVEKRMLLVEEIRLTRRQTQTTATDTVVLRHEEITVDRLPGPLAPTDKDSL